MPSPNPILDYFTQRIDQAISDSPSHLGRWLNGIIREAERGRTVLEFEVREDMTNPSKMLHGGAISAICDDMIGATVMTLNKPTFFTSVNLTVDFFAPAKIGDTLRAEAKVVKEGRQIVHAVCEIYLVKKNRLISKATSNLMRTDIPVS